MSAAHPGFQRLLNAYLYLMRMNDVRRDERPAMRLLIEQAGTLKRDPSDKLKCKICGHLAEVTLDGELEHSCKENHKHWVHLQ